MRKPPLLIIGRQTAHGQPPDSVEHDSLITLRPLFALYALRVARHVLW
ncbi:MAG TPA: hypothetical protein VFT66_25170 [Roseiflexaceae bacterium]|nr:hypothetical protein [Roseiflexaceae bacterium]